MGIQVIEEGKRYRISVDGLGAAGSRRVHSEMCYGSREQARARERDLMRIRNESGRAPRYRWRRVLLPPPIYHKLERVAAELAMSPENLCIDLIEAVADQ